MKATCLDLATYLGDCWGDLVIVGGYVPSLLVPAAENTEEHCGTLDLDLGLSLRVVDRKQYGQIVTRLRQAGYEPDKNDRGEPIHHRWCLAGVSPSANVDFLIENGAGGEPPGSPFHLAPGFGPIRNDALAAAFLDRMEVTLEGLTLRGEHVRRAVQVCGPAAFVVLKSHALKVRGLPKDAYDLFYVIRNYGQEPGAVACRWPLVQHLRAAEEALAILREEFATRRALGTMRVAEFLERKGDQDLLEDVVGFVLRFLSKAPPGAPP